MCMVHRIKSLIKQAKIKHIATFLFIAVTCLPVLICGIYFYISMSRQVEGEFKIAITSLYNQTISQLNSSFTSIDETAKEMVSSSSIQTILSSYDLSQAEYEISTNKQTLSREINNRLMFNYAWTTKIIDSIFLFTKDDDYVYSTRSANLPFVNRYEEVYTNFKLSNEKIRNIFPASQTDPLLYYCTDFMNLYSHETLCSIVIGMTELSIAKNYAEIDRFEGLQSMVFKKNGDIISHTDKSMLGGKVPNEVIQQEHISQLQTIEYKNRSYYIMSNDIDSLDLSYCILYPTASVKRMVLQSMSGYIIALILFILIAMIIGALISKLITSYFSTLRKNLLYVQNGDYSHEMPAFSNNEINHISVTFNSMTRTINNLIHEIYEVSLKQKQTELDILHSQINPHFLINTLVTLSFKAKTAKDENLDKMITALIEMLHVSLYTDNKPYLTIKKELDYIEYYLYLQKMRFEEKIGYSIIIENEELLSHNVPKLCVQNLVENSIVHGLEEKIGNGHIDITVKTNEEGDIAIIVADDGVGFDTASAVASTGSVHHTIGIKNCDSRIKLLYGEEYGVTIKSIVGHSTVATITIPRTKES